ncbi:MAG: DUF4124 domain-containing protein [Pseudomonadota bacterium]|nr:DUF4124 domain-containing protein [Pseudomonadota bacterium]
MPAAVHASKAGGDITVYRCTDGEGRVTLQNGTPCPKGQHQQARKMEAPPPPAAPVMPVAAPTSATLSAPSVPANAEPVAVAAPKPDPLPPPPIHRCRTWDGNSYLSEQGQPPARCIPLQVSGIAGDRHPSAAQACEMRQDHCDVVPDQQRCATWREYDRQAQSMLALGSADIAHQARELYSRTRRVMSETTCANAE